MMLKIALGGVGALVLVVMLAIWRSPSPVVAAEPDQAPFEETWRDAAMPLVFKSAVGQRHRAEDRAGRTRVSGA